MTDLEHAFEKCVSFKQWATWPLKSWLVFVFFKSSRSSRRMTPIDPLCMLPTWKGQNVLYVLCFTFTNTLSTITCCTRNYMEPHNVHLSVDLVHSFIRPSVFITYYHNPHASCDLNLSLRVQKRTNQFFYSAALNSPPSLTLEMLYMLSICPN